jgi:hypothetical protein
MCYSWPNAYPAGFMNEKIGLKSYTPRFLLQFVDSRTKKVIRLKWSPVSLTAEEKVSKTMLGGRDGGGGEIYRGFIRLLAGGPGRGKFQSLNCADEDPPTPPPPPLTPPPGEWNHGTEGVHTQPVWFLHRVGIVLRFFLQSSELRLPHPFSRRRVCPPPFCPGGGHTRLRERGNGGRPTISTRGQTVVLFIYKYFVGSSLSFCLWCKGLEKTPAQMNILKGEKLWGFLCTVKTYWDGELGFEKNCWFELNKCCI